MINSELAKAFNQQIGHEFGASLQYLAIAGHFQQRQLKLLAKLFFDQAEEEKQHAMKFVKVQSSTRRVISRSRPLLRRFRAFHPPKRRWKRRSRGSRR